MLHIHNGDSSGNTAKKSDLPGEHLVWREALVCGPTPAGLTGNDWRKLRAKHLAESYGGTSEEYEEELREQDQALAKFRDHEEVVLWFEHDLFCQVILIYLLDWFSRQEMGHTRLSLICVGTFPGFPDFRGLGELDVDQLASLFPSRHTATKEETKLAQRAWAAYSASDPSQIVALLADDTSALPFLGHALRKHLARFPSIENGLGQIENLALESIARGTSEFGPLFQDFGKAEPTYGLGDAQLWLSLRHLAEVQEPILTIANGNGATLSLSPNASFALTERGSAVLRGEDDFIALNGIDAWLGGVHLEGKEARWRWDQQREELINT